MIYMALHTLGYFNNRSPCEYWGYVFILGLYHLSMSLKDDVNSSYVDSILTQWKTNLGLRELCWNNFGNFEASQYSSRNRGE